MGVSEKGQEITPRSTIFFQKKARQGGAEKVPITGNPLDGLFGKLLVQENHTGLLGRKRVHLIWFSTPFEPKTGPWSAFWPKRGEGHPQGI